MIECRQSAHPPQHQLGLAFAQEEVDVIGDARLFRAGRSLVGGDDGLDQDFERAEARRRQHIALDASRAREELGWEAATHFEAGIAQTVDWYRDNEEWWSPIRSGDYRDYYEKYYGRALG